MRKFIHLSSNQQLIEVYKIVQLKWIMHQVVSTTLLAFLMLRWKHSSAMTGLSAIEVQFNLVAILIYIIVEKMLKKLLVFKSDKLQPQNFNCTSFSCNTNEKRELTHLRPLKYLQNILHFLLILVLIWREAALIRMHCKQWAVYENNATWYDWFVAMKQSLWPSYFLGTASLPSAFECVVVFSITRERV